MDLGIFALINTLCNVFESVYYKKKLRINKLNFKIH